MQPFYIRLKGKVWGPFSIDQLKAMQVQGRLSSFHEVSQDRLGWAPASSAPELGFAPPPRPPSAVFVAQPVDASRRPAAADEQAFEGDYEPPAPAPPPFQAWEARIGWQRARTGLLLMLISCFVAVANFVLLVVGGTSAALGQSGAAFVFIITLFQIGRTISVLLELVGASFCAAVPSQSGARGLGVMALVMLGLHLLVSLFPSVYMVRLGLMQPRAIFMQDREIAGIMAAALIFAAVGALAWVAWNVVHLFYLHVINQLLRKQDASLLPAAGIVLFVAASVLSLLTPCLMGLWSESLRFDRDHGDPATAVIAVVFAALAVCLWVGFFVVYLMTLFMMIGTIDDHRRQAP